MRRFLALGDSYTVGESVPETERWPAQLAGMLRERNIPIDEPKIIATTGWTTGDLAAAIDAAPPLGPYGLVSLLIGVNNQYRGLPVEDYRVGFRDLLARAIALARDDPARALVLSIPDWGVTPFAEGRDRTLIARQIDAFNHVNRQEALAAGTGYVDITDVSRRHPLLLATDGLHPSGDLYRLWAELALPQALAALDQSG